jgi:hypothetical protein
MDDARNWRWTGTTEQANQEFARLCDELSQTDATLWIRLAEGRLPWWRHSQLMYHVSRWWRSTCRELARMAGAPPSDLM